MDIPALQTYRLGGHTSSVDKRPAGQLAGRLAKQGSSTLGILDTPMVWVNPLVFSKSPKLAKNDNLHMSKPPLFSEWD